MGSLGSPNNEEVKVKLMSMEHKVAIKFWKFWANSYLTINSCLKRTSWLHLSYQTRGSLSNAALFVAAGHANIGEVPLYPT